MLSNVHVDYSYISTCIMDIMYQNICILILIFSYIAVSVSGQISCFTMELESQESRYSQHNIGSGKSVTSMGVVDQQSNNPCISGYSYGFLGSIVWVDNGCRAEFSVCYQPGEIVTWRKIHFCWCKELTIIPVFMSTAGSLGEAYCLPHLYMMYFIFWHIINALFI